MANNNNPTDQQQQPDPNPPKPDPPSISNPNPNPNPNLINPQLAPPQSTALAPPAPPQIQPYGTGPPLFRPPQFSPIPNANPNPNPTFQMQPPGVVMMPGQQQYGVPGQQPPPMRMYGPPPNGYAHPQVNGPPGTMNPPVLSW